MISEQNLKDMEALLDIAHGENYTPELPLFRYAGPQRVLLVGYDRYLTRYEKIFGQCEVKAFRCRRKVDYDIVSHAVRTKFKYVLLENNTANYPDYRVYPMFPTNSLQKSGVKAKAAPLSGAVFEVGLKGLQALDFYFAHQYNFTRRKVPLTDDSQVWLYTVPEARVLKFDPHDNTVSLPANSKLEQATLGGGPDDDKRFYV